MDDLFKPLHTTSAYRHPRYYTDVKAKGHYDRAPWVRLYAVKCDENLYVLTGYAIKLVREMREDKHLKEELNKLERATTFLHEIQMISQ